MSFITIQMGIGIFNKIKKAFKTVGRKVGDFVKNKLPGVIDVGKKIIGAVKPVVSAIPGVSNVVNAIDTGLNIANNAGKFGKSILDEVK